VIFPLTAAQLVIARRYGFASWAGLRRDVAMVIQPVTSPREPARAFEPIGARRARLGWSRTGISCSWPAGSGQTGR
jgi:hypothetical protein